MVRIAGIESRDKVDGYLLEARPIIKFGDNRHMRNTEFNATVRADEMLYTHEAVIEILKRFDFFKNRYNDIVKEKGGDLAMRRAKYMLKYNYAGNDWKGIDEFIGSSVAEY